jgi:hypothetical protein
MAIEVLEIRLDDKEQASARRVIGLAETVAEAEGIAKAEAEIHPKHGYCEEQGWWWGISADGTKYRYCRP